MRKNYLLFLVLLFLIRPSLLFCQVNSSHRSNMKAFKAPNPDEVISLSDEKIKALLVEDSIDKINGLPFRFGKDIVVSIDFISKAKSKVRNDTTILTYSIKCPKAYSINLIFDKLKLSDNSTLSIFNKNKKYRYGPITKDDVPETNQFWTDLIPGNQLIIELTTSDDIKDNEIKISKTIFGYKNTFKQNNFGDSLSCHIDVNCPEGQGWEMEKSSISMMLLDEATRWCSSGLLNNTARDFRGFILSAFHCLDSDYNQYLDAGEKAAVNNWMFRFKYESSTCNGIDDNDYITFNGANFRAGYEPTDFVLLELYDAPDINDCIAFAGWSRSSINAASGTGLHHPNGDVKKISFDLDPLYTNTQSKQWLGGAVSPPHTQWIVDFDQGTTEGGSSGSPIFDQNRRIVGQLTGGPDGCAPVTKYYGRFDKSWTGGGTSDTSLKDWLDPINSSLNWMDTEIPLQINGSNSICSSETYSLSTLPAGSTVNWSTTGKISISGNTNSASVIISASGNGSGVLIATVNLPCFQDNIILEKNISAGISQPSSFISVLVEPWNGRIKARVNPVPGATAYTWYLDGIQFGPDLNSDYVVMPISRNDCNTRDYSVAVKAVNACGTSSWLYEIHDNPCYNGEFYYTYSPNPASESLIVEENKIIDSETKGLNLNAGRRLELYDFNGKLVHQEKISKKTKIDVSTLEPGRYILKIILGKEREEKHHIIIN